MSSVIFLRSIDYSLDSRLQKYINILLSSHKENTIQIVCWNRDSELIEKSTPTTVQVSRYNKQSKYGSGFKNIFLLLCWNFYIFKVLLRKSPSDIVHVCDFDCLLPAILLKPIKKYKVIYDIYDFYDLSINISNKLVKNSIRNIDQLLYGFADTLILPDENRRVRIPQRYHQKIVIVENLPYLNNNLDPVRLEQEIHHPNVMFIGTLGKDRNLDKLMEFAGKNKDVQVYIGGFGFMEEQIQSATANISNLNWLGKLDYPSVLAYTQRADIIFASYNPDIENNKYASPNKFYEAVLYLKPILVSENTSVEKYVLSNKIGFSVNYHDYDAIEHVLLNYFNNSILRDEIRINLIKAKQNIFEKNDLGEKYLKVIYG